MNSVLGIALIIAGIILGDAAVRFVLPDARGHWGQRSAGLFLLAAGFCLVVGGARMIDFMAVAHFVGVMAEQGPT